MPKDDIQGLFQYLLKTKTIALFTGVATNFLMTTLRYSSNLWTANNNNRNHNNYYYLNSASKQNYSSMYRTNQGVVKIGPIRIHHLHFYPIRAKEDCLIY